MQHGHPVAVGFWSVFLWGCAPQLSPAVVELAQDAAAQVDCDAVRDRVSSIVTDMEHEPIREDVLEEWGLPLRRTTARDAVLAELEDRGIPHRVVSFADRHVPVENLVVELTGTGAGPGDAPAGEVIHLTAHYDVWHTGADDNTSGVSTALEAARILHSFDLSRTVQILFYDLEETGLDGSLAWWDRHGDQRVHAVLNLDAIAYASSAEGSQSAPPGFRLPSKGDFILGLANGAAEHHVRWMTELSVAIDGSAPFMGVYGPANHEHPATSDFHRSDHSPAWERGVAGVFVTDTANLRNPHYHQDSDLPDTLDPAFHCGVSRLVAGAAVAFAEAP